MPLNNKTLTERETAVLYYHVFADVQDWKKLYLLADPETDPDKIKYLDTIVSRWRNSEKIKKALQMIQDQKTIQEERQKEKGRQEERNKDRENNDRSETGTETHKNKNIDYSDPRNRQKLYNEVIANSGDDYKTKLDAAKVFEQIQRDDREAAKAQKQSKIYLPLRCEQCALYQKQKKRL